MIAGVGDERITKADRLSRFKKNASGSETRERESGFKGKHQKITRTLRLFNETDHGR